MTAGLCRLGGIPVGVIAVETRSVELTIPADPANLDSEVKVREEIITSLCTVAGAVLCRERNPGHQATLHRACKVARTISHLTSI